MARIRTLLTLSLIAASSATLFAQDIYQVESLSRQDLSGTARFISMGGAMGALGADISTMTTNPAGIALFRRSDASLTGGLVAQPEGRMFDGKHKNTASFDQAGIVIAMPFSGESVRFVNFGFNYHKSRNFKQYLGAEGIYLDGWSQTQQMLDLAYGSYGWYDLSQSHERELAPPLAILGYDTALLYPNPDYKKPGGNNKDLMYLPCEGEVYDYHRVQSGGIQSYDFNLALNFSDRYYAGLTFGLHHVDRRSFTEYSELLIDGNDYFTQAEEKLTGFGVDLKLGFVFRPVEESPLRLGLYVHTPTWYDLESESSLLVSSSYHSMQPNGTTRPFSEAYMEPGLNAYKLRTPWRFGLNAATTVDNLIALSAEYEFSHQRSAGVSYGDYDDLGWNNYDDLSEDKGLSQEIDRYLLPVHTLRLGAEVRIPEGFSLRCGYNFVSRPMKKEAFLNFFTESPAYYYSTGTDYLNLGATHRYTFGLGYRAKRIYADVAYLYQQQKGDLYAFHIPNAADRGDFRNVLTPQSLKLDRHNVMLTLGYKF